MFIPLFLKKSTVFERCKKREDGTIIKKPSLTETTIKHNPRCICRKCVIKRKK